MKRWSYKQGSHKAGSTVQCNTINETTVGLACEEALHFGDIVKSGQMRGMQEEMRKQGRERRACNDHS